MRIICPQCGFERNVDVDKVPPKAKLATCPKCNFKFQFRDLESDAPPREAPTAQTPQPPEEPIKTPQTYGPEGKPVESTPSEPDETTAPGPRHSKSEDDQDLWDKLEALAPGEPDASNADAPFEPEREFDEQPGASSDERVDHPDLSQGPDPETLSIEVPFEDPENFSFVEGLIATIRRLLLHPKLFFSTMPLPRGMVRPLFYYAITSELLAIIMFVWMAVGLAVLQNFEDGGQAAEMLAELSMHNDPLSLVIYPMIAVVSLYVRTAVTHLVLMIFGQSKAGFEGTFRAFSYGSTPYLLAVFPVVGLVVGGVISVVYTIIGLMRLHRIGAGKAVLAYVLPIAAWFLFVFLMMQPPSGAA